MSQLRHLYPALRELNAEVLLLAAVDRPRLADFARELALPFPALADPSGRVFRNYGLGKGLAIRPRTPLAFLRLILRERRLYRPVGDVMQVGGDFVVDPQGVIRYAHSSEDPTDRPAPDMLLEVVRRIS